MASRQGEIVRPKGDWLQSGINRFCRPFGALVKLSGFDLLENNEAAVGLYCYAMAGRSYLDGHGAVAACID